MWERWRQGDTLREIARLLERPPSSVFKRLSRTDSIQPASRTRSTRALSLDEREVISRGLATGQSLRAIAVELNRAPSTVSREVECNGGRENYRVASADQSTWERALRPEVCKLAGQAKLVRAIATNLIQQWSPQQIAGWLKPRTQTTSCITCPTKPFTKHFTYRPEEHLKKNCFHVCEPRE